MGFLAPISFWFLSVIPLIILFYFFKKQYDNMPISSIYLWESTINQWETDRWWNKLQKNLLLLLQLLFLFFLIFALTRPFLPGEEFRGDHLVIILDSSATMTTLENDQTRFQNVKEQAKDLVSKLSNEHLVSVIDARNTPELIVSNETNHRAVQDAIHDRNISYQHQNMEDSIQLAQSLIARGSGEIHIFTDHFSRQAIDEQQVNHKVTVHNRQTRNENLALQTFGVKQTAEYVSAVVTVTNETSESRELTLSISGNGEELDMITKTMEPQAEETFTINSLPVHDYYQAQINSDSYQLDNTLIALLPDQQASTIYVAGEVSPFVHRALQAAGFETTTINQDETGNYHFPPEANNEAIYLLSGVEAKTWPDGPKLVVSPSTNGPFGITEKRELSYMLSPIAEDPVLSYTDINLVYLSKAYQVGDWHGLRPLVTSGDQVVLAKGDYLGDPMVMLPFDIEDSDWPLHAGFPIFLANTIEYLTDQSRYLGYYQPMESVAMSFSPLTEEAVIETIEGESVKTIDLNESTVTVPTKPGIYQVHEKSSVGSTLRYFVVQLHSGERTATNADSFALSTEEQQDEQLTLSKLELWQLFAGIALLLLFIEWEVYRRGLASR